MKHNRFMQKKINTYNASTTKNARHVAHSETSLKFQEIPHFVQGDACRCLPQKVWGTRKKINDGFSLLELLIVLVIMGVLYSFVYPSWQSYWVRTRRLDGQLALMTLAQQMENYYSQHGRYTQNNSENGGHDDPIDMNPLSAEAWYSLSIVEASDDHFILQATPRGAQAVQDLECQSLRFNDRGEMAITSGPAGYPSGRAEKCW